MRLRTTKEQFGLVTESETNAKVSHSQKRTFKGSKIARVQNIVQEFQADKLDRKNEWQEQRNKRKQERQRNKGL